MHVNGAISLIGLLVLFLALFSGLIKRIGLSEPLCALLAGIAVGPAGAGLVELANWGNPRTIVEQAARLTVAVSLMGIALRVPTSFYGRRLKALAVLLVPVMLLMCLVSGALTWALLPVGLWTALLIGAIVTPTDPVLASSIVTGTMAQRMLPADLRDTISAESGANDGLTYPLVYTPLFILGSVGQLPAGAWSAKLLLWQVAGAALLGLGVGLAAGSLLRWAESRHWMETTSLLSYSLALTLAVLGLARLIGTDGILAVFTAGCGLAARLGKDERGSEERIQESVNTFFILPAFVLLGVVLPWDAWAELGWRGPALAVLILLLRRLPALLLLRRLIAPLRERPEAWFAGWFGPIGVAALYYTAFATHHVQVDTIWATGTLVIAASVVVHGVTATPFMHWYVRVRGQPNRDQG